MEQYKTCTRCKQTKSLSDFHKWKKSKDQHHYLCAICQNEQNRISYHKNKEAISLRRKSNLEQKAKNLVISKKWIAENPERARKLWSDWSKNNPDKTRKKNSARRSRIMGSRVFEITPKEIAKLRSLPCFYCGAPSKELDHVVPISRGGTHSIGNLVPACKPCNGSKGAKFITEWKKSQTLIVK